MPMGCGPVQYFGQASGSAARAIDAAERSSAGEFAPYEMVKARAYYQKSREQAGQSSFEVAITYARQAEQLAIRAATVARERAQRRLRPASPSPARPAATPPAPSSFPSEAPSLPEAPP